MDLRVKKRDQVSIVTLAEFLPNFTGAAFWEVDYSNLGQSKSSFV